MYAHRIRNAQAHNHQILVTLPPDFPDIAFDVIVVGEPDAEPVAQSKGGPRAEDLDALFDFLKTIPPTGRTQEEIDRQIREERDAWER